jgi:hypothetical protein
MQQWKRFLCGLSRGNNGGSRVFFGSVPVMTSCNRRGSEAVFSLGSVHGLYNQGHQPASLVYRVSS